MDMDFDDILTQLGTGKWNIFHFCAASFYFFVMPCFAIAGVFLVPNTPFTCQVPQPLNESVVEINECNYTFYQDYNATGDITTMKCSSWLFDQEENAETLTSEFELVCDYGYLRPTYQTLYAIGIIISAPVNGLLSDKYGRKVMYSVAAVIGILMSWTSSFLQSFPAILATRFVLGFTAPGAIQTGFTYCMEICEPKIRSTFGMMISLPWAFGTVWWGVLAYLIRDWRWLQRASTVPCFVLIMSLFFMDESPRWLIVRGHHDKALRVLKKAAGWNNAELPSDSDLINTMKNIQASSITKLSESQTETRSGKNSKFMNFIRHVFSLFRTPEMRKRTLLMYVLFVVSATVFLGLSLNAVNFNVDPYMYMVIGGLTEIPSYTVAVPIIAKLGRVKPTASMYLICGVTIMVLAFISGPVWLIITLAMVGKFSISAAYQIIYLMTSELFPTESRLHALGTCSFTGRLGSMMAPFITESLGSAVPWLPSILFGSLSLIATVAAMFLPETLNIHLPETILQLEEEAKRKYDRKCSENKSQELEKVTLNDSFMSS